MFPVNVWLTVKDPNDVPTVGELLPQIRRISLTETACLRFEVYHSQSDPTRFLLTEHWDSEDGWKAHREQPVFTEIYRPKVLPLVDREPHVCTLLE
ncbi:MAG: antibiotic biosynthesis monooxygenase [Planctomycetaceae bacterium]|nr:antibiotic biosynthesis monooxygenase [Planctomycetaceae bacterium]